MDRTCTLCNVTTSSDYRWECHISTDEHRHNLLVSACIRMMVGITGASTDNCDWYEGIEKDAAEEARDVLQDMRLI